MVSESAFSQNEPAESSTLPQPRWSNVALKTNSDNIILLTYTEAVFGAEIKEAATVLMLAMDVAANAVKQCSWTLFLARGIDSLTSLQKRLSSNFLPGRAEVLLLICVQIDYLMKDHHVRGWWALKYR